MCENKKADGVCGCTQNTPSDKCNCNSIIPQNEENIKDKIQELIQAELERAAAIHGDKFHSSHEAYAVLKEEMEEVKECASDWDLKLDGLWRVIREDNSVPLYLRILEQREVLSEKDGISVILENAKHLITEAVQVAAMCEKYLNFLEGEENATKQS